MSVHGASAEGTKVKSQNYNLGDSLDSEIIFGICAETGKTGNLAVT